MREISKNYENEGIFKLRFGTKNFIVVFRHHTISV